MLRVSQSNKSSSEYNTKNIFTNPFKVNNKIKKLLETDNPVPIIDKLKSIAYIDKILETMKLPFVLIGDDRKKKGERVENELKERRSKIIRTLIEEERQERIERNKEELKELKSKLERLEKKLKNYVRINHITNQNLWKRIVKPQ
jgi:DNA repair exonuclease SbcCD ATPase subunit